MKNQLLPLAIHRKSPVKSSLTAIMLGLTLSFPLSLTACGNKPAEQDAHAEHDHDEHNHAEHENSEEAHAHEEHDHEGHNHEEHNHEGHDHDHAHNHAHGTGAEQVIPEGYTVNFAVSNYPLFLLSEVVTADTPTTVKRLLGAGDVGHHGSLSPSDMKTVQDSKFVVWFGEGLESNLTETLTDGDNTVTLMDLSAVSKLPRRDEQTKTITDTEDPHIWSNPENAKVIVNKLAELHTEVNPEYAKQYKANAKKFAEALDKLVAEQKAKVGEFNQYWSSHDAFQYFEKALGIELAGTLTTDHEIPAKASQIVWLKQNRPYATMCLLAQSEPKEGIKNKLAPVVTKVLIEDMSDSTSYLEAWKTESQKVIDCLATSIAK